MLLIKPYYPVTLTIAGEIVQLLAGARKRRGFRV